MCTVSAVQRTQEGTSCHTTMNYFSLHRSRHFGTTDITAAVGKMCTQSIRSKTSVEAVLGSFDGIGGVKLAI